jgi:hypothetical protein
VPYEQSIEEAFAVQGAPSLDLKTVEKGSPWVSARSAVEIGSGA